MPFSVIALDKADQALASICKDRNFIDISKQFELVDAYAGERMRDELPQYVVPIFEPGHGFLFRISIISGKEIKILQTDFIYGTTKYEAKNKFLEKYYNEVVSKKA